MALKYHPDKCKLPDANTRFIQIREAYALLSSFKLAPPDDDEEPDMSYASMFAAFVKNVVKVWKEPDENTRLYHLILVKAVGLCEKQALEYLRQIDRSKLAKVVMVAKMHADVFGFSSEFIAKLDRILSGETEETDISLDVSRIYLNPLLEDLLADNLYRLNWGEEQLIIPMWHHETSYDVSKTASGYDLSVCCVPVLPPNMELEEDNTLVVTVEYCAGKIINSGDVVVEVANKRLKIDVGELRLVREQWVVFEGQGVAAMNVEDVYDVSVRRPIKVRVLLK